MGKDLLKELQRLSELRRYRVLDTPPEESFDGITELAAQIFKVPYAGISFVDEGRVWFKSHFGLEVDEVDRITGLCVTTITESEAYVLPDTTQDPRSAEHPLVTGSPYLRFYAGYPLETKDQHSLGALCVMDRLPREVSPQEIKILHTLASIVVELLELRLYGQTISRLNRELQKTQKELANRAYFDSLTGVANRFAILEALEKTLIRAQREKKPLSILLIDIDNFKAVNDTFGHLAGDEVLCEVATRMANDVRGSDHLGRLGGEEFLFVLYPCDDKEGEEIGNRLIKAIAEDHVVVDSLHLDITISCGLSTWIPNYLIAQSNTLLKRADIALYAAKHAGKNCLRKDCGP